MVVTSTARRVVAALSTRLTVDRDFPTEILVITMIMRTKRAAAFSKGALGIATQYYTVTDLTNYIA